VARPGSRLGLLDMRPHGGTHRVAARAAVSVLVPLLVIHLLGRPEWSSYAAFGAFASLYGRNHVHLSRASMQLTAGAALVACVVLGALVSTLPTARWWAVPVAALVALGGSALALAQDWHPPGSLFLVFAFGACASFEHDLSEVTTALVVSALSALFAVGVGMAGAVVRGHAAPPARVQWHRSWLPLRDACAVALSGFIATASGIGHPYWAMVAAVAPLAARGVTGQLTRAIHRVVGTLLGCLTSLLLLSLDLSGLLLILAIAALQFTTELLVGRNYGLAMLFITPMALLMGQTAGPTPTGTLLFDRAVETAIGGAVGVGILVAVRLRTRPHRQGAATAL
jgi:hypothetical protein